MGVTPSVNLSNVPKNMEKFGITFGHTDRLRLILAPPDVVNTTRRILETYWIIQEVSEQEGFIEFKLKGTPWCPSRYTDVGVKYFMCSLLKEYFALGWHIKVSTDLQRVGSDSSSLIFQKQEYLSTSVICISLNESDKIRVLAPEDLIPHVRTVIMTTWPLGIQNEQRVDRSYEFKLKGNPWSTWSADNEETYYSVNMINALLATFYNQRWAFVGSIKTGKRQYDMNSLYFRFDEPKPSEQNEPRAPSYFMAASLHRNDRIRLFNAPPELIMVMRSMISQHWPRGIQEEFQLIGSYEFKLKGNPWWANGEETVDSRRLVSGLFNALRQYGWDIYAICELTKHLSAKSSFFFRYNPQPEARFTRTICVSLNEADKIRIIDGNENLINCAQHAVMSGWPSGIQEQRPYGTSYQIKMNGYPFSATGGNSVYALVMMIFLLNNFQHQGLTFICSANVSSKYHSDKNSSYPLDLDSWYFRDR